MKNDILLLANKTGLDVLKISPFTANTYYIKTRDNQVYFLKALNENSVKIYEYLKYHGADILYPIKTIRDNNIFYYLFEYKTNNSDLVVSVREIAASIEDIQAKTTKHVVLKKENFQNLYKIYQILDQRFTTLEMMVRQIEVTPYKTDNSWIVLSKYRIYLHAKKIMYALQKKIHQAIDNEEKVDYAINHGNPSISHYKGNKLIGYNNAYFGFVVSDIARFYVEADHIEMDIFKVVDDWLSKYENPFYKTYFKFQVLYIYMINLRINNLNGKHEIMNFMQIAKRINKVIFLFKDYK